MLAGLVVEPEPKLRLVLPLLEPGELELLELRLPLEKEPEVVPPLMPGRDSPLDPPLLRTARPADDDIAEAVSLPMTPSTVNPHSKPSAIRQRLRQVLISLVEVKRSVLSGITISSSCLVPARCMAFF